MDHKTYKRIGELEQRVDEMRQNMEKMQEALRILTERRRGRPSADDQHAIQQAIGL